MRRGLTAAGLTALVALATASCGSRVSAAPDTSGATTAASLPRAHPPGDRACGRRPGDAVLWIADHAQRRHQRACSPAGPGQAQLVQLNLCGGAASSAQAQPVVGSSGPGFLADPGTIQSVGDLPVLTARLNALAKALHVTIHGISGYRTPAHSVAVGGYSDDPHTKGEADDIGVGNLLRSSAAQISEAQLARFGLYRPFDPSDDRRNSEVNHIQLIPSGGPVPVVVAEATFAPDPSCR